MEVRFEKSCFGKRLSSMLKVDFRRMFTTRFLYIMVGICIAMPILMLVIGSMVAAMLLYMLAPMVTPLDSGIANVIGCFTAGGLICFGLGAVSCQVWKRTSLV